MNWMLRVILWAAYLAPGLATMLAMMAMVPDLLIPSNKVISVAARSVF